MAFTHKKENQKMTKWRIRYYLTEGAYRCGCPSFTETITGNRTSVISWAQNKLQHSQFKFYDLTEL